MCEARMAKTREPCPHPSRYWVMTRREITLSSPVLGEHRSQLNLLVCGMHLGETVAQLGKVNREAYANDPFPRSDGVIVKTQTTNPLTGWAVWK